MPNEKSPHVAAAIDHARAHREDNLERLEQLLRIPSVSTDPAHADDIARAAEWVVGYLEQIGLDQVQKIETSGHDVVYGEWRNAGSDAFTLLIYGHYDVQPVDPIELWRSPPFEPIVRGEDLFCRGVSDDKGLFFAMLAGLDAWLRATGSLPINVKVLLEGEEEISSPNMHDVFDRHRTLLACDAAVISDQPMFASDMPAICYGVRGACYLQVDVTGPSVDFHSGTAGGAIENPLNALVRMLAQVQGPDHRVRIPGFYDRVRIPDDAERKLLAQAPVNDDVVKHFTGVREVAGEPGFTSSERISIRPTFEIHGMPGGYTGPGKKSLIPSKASAKVSMRLVPDQDPVEIARLFEDFLRTIAPPTIEWAVTIQGMSYPVVLDYSVPAIQAADRAYQSAFGHPAVYFRAGGSLPVVNDMVGILGVPVALIGFGLPDDRCHAPNEKLHLPDFYRGIEMAIHYYHELSMLSES